MKTKSLIFAFMLSFITGASAQEGWDDLVLTANLFHAVKNYKVPNVPCHVYFENVTDQRYDQWAFSDSLGNVEVKFPASSSSLGAGSIRIKIGYGTKWYATSQEAPTEVANIGDVIPQPDTRPDTIDMMGWNPWRELNTEGVAPDSLVIANTLLDSATGLGIENATAVIKYKRYPSDPDWQITRTASSDQDGLIRYALYNDLYMRVVSVSYTVPGYAAPADHVDFISKNDAVWDGINDQIPGKTLELRAQTVGVRYQSAYTRNAQASVKLYSLNGRVVGTTTNTSTAALLGLARSKRTIGVQRVVVK